MPAPSTYDAEVAERICLDLMDGKSLVQALRAKGSPSRATVYRWLLEHPEFKDSYNLAREVQAHGLCDLAIEVAHKKTMSDPRAEAVRLKAIEWAAGKLKPDAYGPKSETTLKGDALAPLNIMLKAYQVAAAE
jgi:hypothetical protein